MFTSVNEGLFTKDGSLNPKPRAIPRVNVVFPTPRAPRNITMPGIGNLEASFAPNFSVSSADLLAIVIIRRFRPALQSFFMPGACLRVDGPLGLPEAKKREMEDETY